jgi:hypothetical protein
LSAPFDTILTIDFETYWDSKEYTLSKMTTEEYIRGQSFTAFGMGVHAYGDGQPTRWVRGDDIHQFVQEYDWGRTAVLAHNAQFDASILSWQYGVQPAFIFDTLSMGRALRGVEVGNSLAKLANDFGLPPKGRAVHSTDGLATLTPEIEKELAEYCAHDVYLCEEIFKRLVDGYPTSELRLIDMTLKMYTRPMLVLDQNMLAKELIEERDNREALLKKLNIDESTLASNPQFAQLLESLHVPPPMKKSKTTGNQTYALAKNDAMFQALLNGDNDDVRLLCEARLKVKSTTERTRAQRFLEIAQRGTLPVPLSYYGALSGRWTASKGSAINMQNLKRGSFLRKAIMAPEDHQIVVGDLSQIEPRVLAWLSDYTEMLGIFRAGGDPYAAFGAQMFGIPGMTKDSHPLLRQSAKSALLGCFGPDTPVLTKRGWIPIIRVQATDTVWDGKEWVCHQGLVPQGEKEVLTALGISATSGHEILTERGWVEWSEALANRSLLKSALSSVSLPASVGNAKTQATTPSCAATAGGRGLLTAITSSKDGAHAAAHAHIKPQFKRGTHSWGTSTRAPMVHTATGYLTESVRLLVGAQTQTVRHTPTTAGEALRFMCRGLQTALSSCATSLASMVGMYPRYSLTGQTIAEDMNRATFASSHAASTCLTNAKQKPETLLSLTNASQPLRQRMQTYDIAYAGPRNRYTILTDAGPLIVHNCGYGLGWASFAAQLLVGFLGAPPLRYTKADARQLGVSQQYVQRFVDWEENLTKMAEIPHTCSEGELLIHCVVAKKIIDVYRATAHPVTSFWDMCSGLIETSLYGGKEHTHKCLTFRKEQIILPNGMSLLYPRLRRKKDETGRSQWVYGEDETKLYAGKVTNNVTQAVARIVMTDGMLRVSKRYPVVGTVHDELLAVVPDEEANDAKTWVLAQMVMEPRYLPGIPLGADGGVHRRYGLAKN